MTERREALVARLRRYDSLVEIGVGRRPDVAAALAAAGCDVTATDVREFPVPAGVRFVPDDVVERSREADPGPLYAVDAVYGLNLPPELHRPALAVARAAGAAFLFTTLGFDEPAVPVERETLPGETLFVAHDGGPRSGRSVGGSTDGRAADERPPEERPID
ncbi:MAG: UPF0146 family protein [Salinigranum sp.]